MGDNALIKLEQFSKPATVLVERISDLFGGIFKPVQIRRVARAEAEAEIIRAKAQVEIEHMQLYHRTRQRFFQEEVRKQTNIEDITKKALPR